MDKQIKQLTEEQRSIITPLASYLDTAFHSDYVRAMTRAEATTLNEIYNQLGYPKKNLSCPKCVLEICKTLGKLYFN